MNDPDGVEVIERRCDLRKPSPCIADLTRPRLLDDVLERRALNELEDDEEVPRREVDVVYGGDARVRDLRKDSGLSSEAFQLSFGELGGKCDSLWSRLT